MSWWVYKCNSKRHKYQRAWGDWAKFFFRGKQTQRWGNVEWTPSIARLKRGDMIIAYQTDRNEFTGIAKVRRSCERDGWLYLERLRSVEAKVRPLKEADPDVASIPALRRGPIQTIYQISNDDAMRLLAAADSTAVGDQPAEWLTTQTKGEFEKVAAIDGPLDREHTVKGRIEQGYLRRKLFGDAKEANCSLCGRRLPLNLLVAAHIKARSKCSRRERLDADNIVFGICLLGCDALYERGLVAISSRGRLCVSPTAMSVGIRNVLASYRGRKCAAWRKTNACYFEWHLSRRFQRKRPPVV